LFERKGDSRERVIGKILEGTTLELLKSDGAEHGAVVENTQYYLFFTPDC
jgi:hypothetical protein